MKLTLRVMDLANRKTGLLDKKVSMSEFEFIQLDGVDKKSTWEEINTAFHKLEGYDPKDEPINWEIVASAEISSGVRVAELRSKGGNAYRQLYVIDPLDQE